MKAFYDNEPSTMEAVGNGDYLYRWGIHQETMTDGEHERTQYACNEVTVKGKPDYGKCVEAVIRDSYTQEEEFALINKYNAYQQGLNDGTEAVTGYMEYLSFVNDVKAMVREALELEAETETVQAASSRLADIAKLLTLTVNTMGLTSTEALAVKSVYPEWEAGIAVTVGQRYNCDGDLWEVVQAHTTQSDWKPSMQTLSLWKKVQAEHAGTQDDPIPYEQGMALEKDKYYTQYDVTYLCIQSSGALVYDLYQIPSLATPL